MKTILTVIILGLISGCSATGPKFQAESQITNNGRSILYIYRPDSWALQAVQSHFAINDKKFIELKNNGYTYVYLDPGQYKLKQNWDGWSATNKAITGQSLELDIQVAENSPTYVEINSDWGYLGMGYQVGWALKETPENVALKRIKETKYQENLFNE